MSGEGLILGVGQPGVRRDTGELDDLFVQLTDDPILRGELGVA